MGFRQLLPMLSVRVFIVDMIPCAISQEQHMFQLLRFLLLCIRLPQLISRVFPLLVQSIFLVRVAL